MRSKEKSLRKMSKDQTLSTLFKIIINIFDLRTKDFRDVTKEYPPFLKPIWKLDLNLIILVEELGMIKGSEKENTKPCIHIILIIIRWRFEVLRKHFVGWKRLSPLNFINNFENLTFWITNLCRVFVLNIWNFYRICIYKDKFI